ncbi:hypothetical protein [Microbacterium sp. NPDC058389]|uniref:hypothetical protein n=1 Tax=Microbacterium sp. NPDC058389 TaxID=3346475 RepID=UPI003669627A
MGVSGNPAKRAERNSKKGIAIHHVMKADEDFDDTADMLFQLVRTAEANHPGKPRYLYLDVDGHRNSSGGFDHDALEIIKEYILGFLAPYLTEVHNPFGHFRPSRAQRNDLPERITVLTTDDERRSETMRAAVAAGLEVYDSNVGSERHPVEEE